MKTTNAIRFTADQNAYLEDLALRHFDGFAAYDYAPIIKRLIQEMCDGEGLEFSGLAINKDSSYDEENQDLTYFYDVEFNIGTKKIKATFTEDTASAIEKIYANLLEISA